MNENSFISSLNQFAETYRSNLLMMMNNVDWADVEALGNELLSCYHDGRRVLICGNGGSGANAIHMANDFLYGINKKLGGGLRCKALTANSSVITCLANDEEYSEIFAYQIATEGDPHDLLLVLSGSGNSPNILRAIEEANSRGMTTFGILGFDGGQAKSLVHQHIHVPIDDMQISEDFQMIFAHIISQWMFSMLGDPSL